jgi:hypothetical protein
MQLQDYAGVSAAFALVWALAGIVRLSCVSCSVSPATNVRERAQTVLRSFVYLSAVQGIFLLGPGAFFDDTAGLIMPIAFTLFVPVKYYLFTREPRVRFGNFLTAAGPHAVIVVVAFALTTRFVVREMTVLQIASWTVNFCAILVGMASMLRVLAPSTAYRRV